MNDLKVKIYSDGANVDDMVSADSQNLVDGFTTNPTLMAKAGIKDYLGFAKEVLSKIKEIAPTIHRYRFDHVDKKVIQIEEDEKEIAIFLPLERFRKSSKSAVWSDSKGRF